MRPTVQIKPVKYTVINSAFETMERKGIGHHESITDGISEEKNRTYARRCMDHFSYFLRQFASLKWLVIQKYGGG